jgi:hypothetical protein
MTARIAIALAAILILAAHTSAQTPEPLATEKADGPARSETMPGDKVPLVVGVQNSS